jgi:hypothetical protein
MSSTFRFDRFHRTLSLLALGLAVALGAASPAAAGDELTLRVNDAEGVPGGEVAIVVRTYAPRPVGQGQICLRTCLTGLTGVRLACFSAVEGFLVFSTAGDAQSQLTAHQQGSSQIVDVEFESPSGSINEADGPLAVVLLRLSDSIGVGARISVEIDAANTFLYDASGSRIPIDPRGGTVTVRDPVDHFKLLADGDRIRPGQTADLAIESLEIMPVIGGRMAFVYDPQIAAGPPVVSFDTRLGQVAFTVDNSVPGRTVIDFESPQGSLNNIPGGLVRLRLPTSAAVPPGTMSRIRLDSDTFLETVDHQFPVIKLFDDWIEFE